MITLAVCFTFCSVWCLYAISDKVAFQKVGIILKLSKKPWASKLGGLGFLFLSAMVLCALYGYAVGVILAITLWMTVASAVVLLAPFPKFNFKYAILTTILSIVLELLLYYTF